MENDKYFTCIKCGNRYLKTDLLVHDARCKVKNYNNHYLHFLYIPKQSSNKYVYHDHV